MTHIFRCFAVALALPLCALSAQEAPTVAPGTRVRVRNAEEPQRVRAIGTLESIDSSTIIVRRENGETVNVLRQPDTRLDVSGGPGRCSLGRRGTCIAIGFLSGAALGAVTGLIIGLNQGCATEGDCVAYPIAGGLPGALLGVFVGAVVGAEHWKNAPLPARLSVGPDGSGRFAVGLTLRF